MARVVEEIPVQYKRVLCQNCGRTIEYVQAEVKSYHGTDYGGGPDGREWIVCPHCGKDITLKSW